MIEPREYQSVVLDLRTFGSSQFLIYLLILRAIESKWARLELIYHTLLKLTFSVNSFGKIVGRNRFFVKFIYGTIAAKQVRDRRYSILTHYSSWLTKPFCRVELHSMACSLETHFTIHHTFPRLLFLVPGHPIPFILAGYISRLISPDFANLSLLNPRNQSTPISLQPAQRDGYTTFLDTGFPVTARNPPANVS